MGNFISRPDDSCVDGIDADWEEEVKPVENQGPLDLCVLPQELLYNIVERLNYRAYVQLEQTSKSMSTTLNNRNFTLEHYVDSVFLNKKTLKLAQYSRYYDHLVGIRRIQWHSVDKSARIRIGILYLNCRASNARLKAVSKVFEKSKTTAQNLWITQHVTFDPEALFQLIKVLKVNQLESRQFLPREFFLNPDEGLHLVEGIAFDTTGCTDEDLLNLKLAYITMTSDFITDRGLNRFLKQWKKGERQLVYFSMDLGSTFGQRNFDTILDGLDASILWTPDTHEYSMISAVKLEDLELMKTGDPQHLYIIWNSDFPEDVRLVNLSQGHVEVINIISETHTLLGYLSKDQFYLARNQCWYCRKEFCIHRRRYTIQRFKKCYPRVNDAIIRGIQGTNILLLGVRCIQVAHGAATPSPPLSKDKLIRIYYEEEASRSLFNNIVYHLRIYLLNQ